MLQGKTLFYCRPERNDRRRWGNRRGTSLLADHNNMILAREVLVLAGICSLHLATGANNTVKLAVLLPAEGPFPFVKHKVLPAIDIAVKVVENRRYLPDHNIVINFRDDECSETWGPLRAIDLYVEKNVDVYLGPCCDFAVAPVARFSPHWNIPVLSAGAFVQAFDDKIEFKQLTRMLTTYAKVAEVVDEVTQAYNWTTIGLLFHDNLVNRAGSKSTEFFTMEPIFYRFKSADFEPWYKMFDQNYNYTFNPRSLLEEASLKTRSK